MKRQQKKKYTKHLKLHVPTGSLFTNEELYKFYRDLIPDVVTLGRFKTLYPNNIITIFDNINQEWRLVDVGSGKILNRYKVNETQFAQIVAVKLTRKN